MRIISDFHDYYDAVQATGQDQTLVCLRKPEEVEFSETTGREQQVNAMLRSFGGSACRLQSRCITACERAVG
jgi:hypothetical protein